MKIKESLISDEVLEKIKNPDPVEGEDILIEGENGELIGVIIQPKAYEFFLERMEESENEMDSALDEKYDSSAKSLDDLLGEDSDE